MVPDEFKKNQNVALWLVGSWYAEPDKPTTCRLNQLYAGKTGIATSNLLVLLLVAVLVAGLLIYQLAGIWLSFGLRPFKYCWLLVAESLTGLPLGASVSHLKDNFIMIIKYFIMIIKCFIMIIKSPFPNILFNLN